MSGPIVRTGATPEFSEGWDRVFGGKKTGRKPAKAVKTAPPKAAKPKKGRKK